MCIPSNDNNCPFPRFAFTTLNLNNIIIRGKNSTGSFVTLKFDQNCVIRSAFDLCAVSRTAKNVKIESPRNVRIPFDGRRYFSFHGADENRRLEKCHLRIFRRNAFFVFQSRLRPCVTFINIRRYVLKLKKKKNSLKFFRVVRREYTRERWTEYVLYYVYTLRGWVMRRRRRTWWHARRTGSRRRRR